MGYPEVRVDLPTSLIPSLHLKLKLSGEESGWNLEVLESSGLRLQSHLVSKTQSVHGEWDWRDCNACIGLDDIRQLYISDLEWLRNQPIL